MGPVTVVATVAAIATSVAAAVAPPKVIADIDLSSVLAAEPGWRLTGSQGPEINDPLGVGDDTAPGEIRLCLHKGPAGPCDASLLSPMGDAGDIFSQPHYLIQAKVVRASSGQPLLLLQMASLHSGDGDQRVFTEALAYRRRADRFVRVYSHLTGRNNNQEDRFITSGPLTGDIISADPTDNAPYGFWITVDALTSASSYTQVLRYRSATRYADGNALAVIDSEMPGIEQRLGFWRPGSPLPLPAGKCRKPRLTRMELWCD